MPIEETEFIRAWEIQRIKIAIIRPIGLIGRPAMMEFIAIQRIVFLEELLQFGHNHFMERAGQVLAAGGMRPPIRLIRRYEKEFCLLLRIRQYVSSAEEADVHAGERVDKRTQ